MNIKQKKPASFLEVIKKWVRGNAHLVKSGEYQHFKRNNNKLDIYEPGDVLTGVFVDTTTHREIKGDAEYLGETANPNYKILNGTKL